MAEYFHPTAELPVFGQAPRERADAARNRARLLGAAAQLVERYGASHVTMEAVAAAACVGKGTLFRRFGDRVGLMNALIDHAEHEFQEAFMTGPAPLGPEAEPLERLEAFGISAIRFHLRYLDVLLEAEPCASKRCLGAPRMLRISHVSMLLRQIADGGDTELLAQTLVAQLEPVLLHHLSRQLRIPTERIELGWRDLVRRLTSHGLPDQGTHSACAGHVSA